MIAGLQERVMGRHGSTAADLAADLREGRFVPAILTGIVTGFMAVIIQTSFASLLFSGPLSAMLSQGLGMLLAGTAISIMILALRSGLPSAVSIGQDGAIPLLVANTGAMAARFALLPADTIGPDELSATVFAMIAASTLMTGILFMIVGRLKLSGLVRTIPYPVMGGFLAGTGWILAKGGIEAMTGMPLIPSRLGEFITLHSLMQWVPGLIFALATFIFLNKTRNPFTLPICIVAAIALAYAVFGIADIPTGKARDMGLIMRAVDSRPSLSAFSPSMILNIRWDQLIPALPAIIVTPFIAMLSTVLNIAGIESGTGVELDPDRELATTGTANILACLIPSQSSYISMSLSLIGLKTGVKSRFIGLSGGGVVLVVVLFGTAILGYVPKAVLGGFLVLLGLFFLSDWLVESRKKMPSTDYLIVWAILIAVIILGFMEGVLLGLAITIVLFLARISRVPACRQPRSAATVRSRIVRPLPERRLLDTYGDSIGIHELEGYLFFGSASGFIAKLLDSLGDRGEEGAAARMVLIDFSAVSGFDVSAVDNFTRLARKLNILGCGIVLSSAPERFRMLLERQAGSELSSKIHWLATFDEALAWAEGCLLEEVKQIIQADSSRGRELRDLLIDQVSDTMLDALARREKVEALLADPAIAGRTMKFRAGETVLAPRVAADGVCLIASGTVSERDGDTKIQVLGQGDCFAAQALAGPYAPPNAWVADTDAVVAVLPPGFVCELGAANPALAMEIQRTAIARLAG